MTQEDEIIVVKISRDDAGLYHASSAQLAGVFVSHRELDKIVDDMPEVIRQWYWRHRHMDVEVFQAKPHQTDREYAIAAMAIPAKIAAEAIGR
jgi:hypothetical protein